LKHDGKRDKMTTYINGIMYVDKRSDIYDAVFGDDTWDFRVV
jgi:hypothetical protein